MIDLHSHILPGIDDGAADLNMALQMARLAVADGITTVACTPHILSGVFENDAVSIRRAVSAFSAELHKARIPLKLVVGADVHIAPDLLEKLQGGIVPTLNGSRYFLLEPPHHVVPQRIGELVARLLNAGFIPIITHPERLTWIDNHYGLIASLNEAGCRLQITAGALVGQFGSKVQLHAERFVDEGRVDVVATDAHNVRHRPPSLGQARAWLVQRMGEEMAQELVEGRPSAILANLELPSVSPSRRQAGLLSRALSRLPKFTAGRS